jgi:predicted nuclease with TOPRIM domain
MPSDYDASEFVDGDFQAHKSPSSAASAGFGQPQRAPTRAEVDSRVAEAQQKLAELKREQEELERQRAALEETRRRQMEFQTGRQETIQNLTRGVGLLEEAEFGARRDAEQMAKALVDLRDALAKIQAIHEEAWTKDNFSVELTRALTALENARMEWNTARLKFPILSGTASDPSAGAPAAASPSSASLLAPHGFGELCRLGLGLTWPLAAVALVALAALLVLLMRR